MTLELKGNPNYAAFLYEVRETRALEGLDNLVAVNVAGFQALTSKTTRPGDLFIAVVAGTQISEVYARKLNLYRDSSLNADTGATGYLEANRRVRAIRLRGHASNALLVPINEFGVGLGGVNIGTQFDHVDGVEFCRKYVVPVKNNSNQPAAKKVRAGVSAEFFPEHIDTPQWGRVSDEFKGLDVRVTQKLHGTSIRFGWTVAERPLLRIEKFLTKFGVKIATTEDKFVVGSRRVIKTEGDGAHWYATDIWSDYAEKHHLSESIPRNVIVYGELIGYTPDGAPIQRGYTYNLDKGKAALYIYRVTVIATDGSQYDLSDAAMRQWAAARGLNVVPLLETYSGKQVNVGWLDDLLLDITDKNFFRNFPKKNDEMGISQGFFIEPPVPLSSESPCDEGVVIRAEGITPKVAKFKFPLFYEHESVALDRGDEDIEEQEG